MLVTSKNLADLKPGVLFQGGSAPNELRNLGAREAKDLYTKLGRLPLQVSELELTRNTYFKSYYTF